MAHYVFYFLDGEAVIIEAEDGGKDSPELAFNKRFSRGALQAVDFYERFDNAVTEQDLDYEFCDGVWSKNVCDAMVKRNHPSPVTGTFKDLWSWLAGSFTKGEGYSTVPVVVFGPNPDMATGTEASVPYGIDCGDVFEQSGTDNQFDRVWKTLPRKRSPEDYMKDCAAVLQADTQAECTVFFPPDPNYPEDVLVKAVCSFACGSTAAVFSMCSGE